MAITRPARLQLCDWLAANNVPADSIPLTAELAMHGDLLTVPLARRDGQGRVMFMPDGSPVTEVASFTVTPPPAAVRPYIRSR